MSLADVRLLCVDAFPLSNRRAKIMDGLELVVNKFIENNIPSEIWVDGSFLTHKIEPDDVDIVVRIQNKDLHTMSHVQMNIVEWLDDDLKEAPYYCDSYRFIEFPEDSQFYQQGQWDRAYWIKQYGFNRSETHYKGVAVIKVRGQNE